MLKRWIDLLSNSIIPPSSIITHQPLLSLHTSDQIGLCIVYPDRMAIPPIQSFPLNRLAKRLPVLIFTEDELLRASDCYPIELLEMARTETVLLGESIRPLIDIDAASLRLEIEANCRRNLILLRQKMWHNPLSIPNTLRASFGQLLQTVKYVAALKTTPIEPIENADIDIIAEILELDADQFFSFSISLVKWHTPATWRKLAQDYLDLVAHVVAKIDTLQLS